MSRRGKCECIECYETVSWLVVCIKKVVVYKDDINIGFMKEKIFC